MKIQTFAQNRDIQVHTESISSLLTMKGRQGSCSEVCGAKTFQKNDLEFRVYSILLTLLKMCCKKKWLTQVTFNDKDETTSVGEVTRPSRTGYSKNDGGKHDRKRDV